MRYQRATVLASILALTLAAPLEPRTVVINWPPKRPAEKAKQTSDFTAATTDYGPNTPVWQGPNSGPSAPYTPTGWQSDKPSRGGQQPKAIPIGGSPQTNSNPHDVHNGNPGRQPPHGRGYPSRQTPHGGGGPSHGGGYPPQGGRYSGHRGQPNYRHPNDQVWQGPGGGPGAHYPPSGWMPSGSNGEPSYGAGGSSGHGYPQYKPGAHGRPAHDGGYPNPGPNPHGTYNPPAWGGGGGPQYDSGNYGNEGPYGNSENYGPSGGSPGGYTPHGPGGGQTGNHPAHGSGNSNGGGWDGRGQSQPKPSPKPYAPKLPACLDQRVSNVAFCSAFKRCEPKPARCSEPSIASSQSRPGRSVFDDVRGRQLSDSKLNEQLASSMQADTPGPRGNQHHTRKCDASNDRRVKAMLAEGAADIRPMVDGNLRRRLGEFGTAPASLVKKLEAECRATALVDRAKFVDAAGGRAIPHKYKEACDLNGYFDSLASKAERSTSRRVEAGEFFSTVFGKLIKAEWPSAIEFCASICRSRKRGADVARCVVGCAETTQHNCWSQCSAGACKAGCRRAHVFRWRKLFPCISHCNDICTYE